MNSLINPFNDNRLRHFLFNPILFMDLENDNKDKWIIHNLSTINNVRLFGKPFKKKPIICCLVSTEIPLKLLQNRAGNLNSKNPFRNSCYI